MSELEDDRGVPRECYVAREDLGAAEGGLIGGFTFIGACAATGAILASGGTLVPAIVGAALWGGVGATIGGALARVVGHHYAEHLQEQIAHGGLLLWVRTHDSEQEARAGWVFAAVEAANGSYRRRPPETRRPVSGINLGRWRQCGPTLKAAETCATVDHFAMGYHGHNCMS